MNTNWFITRTDLNSFNLFIFLLRLDTRARIYKTDRTAIYSFPLPIYFPFQSLIGKYHDKNNS